MLKTQKNEWSREDPITQNWCFSDKIKLAHSSPVTKKDRKVYFRKTENETCDCRLLYKGDEDFLLRIGGSTEAKNHTKTVSLVSYGLLMDFTLEFMEHGQTITGFHKAYQAKCIRKFGRCIDELISLITWKRAVSEFWKDILKLDIKKSFTCQNCGSLPPTLVFDGVTLGIQVRKLKNSRIECNLSLGGGARQYSREQFSDREH